MAVGLFAAGVGTMIFLRNAQIAAIDDQLRSVVSTDLASTLMEIEIVDGTVVIEPKEDSTLTPFFIAVYAPDGTLLETAGGQGGPPPAYPSTFELQRTIMTGIEPFELDSVDGSRTFHASVDVLPLPRVSDNYTQLVALPLSAVTQTVTNFIGIYTAFALLTILGAALFTRWLVTLTFRGLGQVERTAMSIADGDFGQRMTDISPKTEVGRLKTAINTMLDRIDEALGQRDATVRQMRRFIGDASHELRTPLVTVRGYAELYRMGAIAGDEQTAQSMERIEKEATRMGLLVEDLLALARLDERRDIVVTEVDLLPIARDATLDARVTAPDRVITLIQHAATEAAAEAAAEGAPEKASVPDTETTDIRTRRSPASLAGSLSRLRRRPKSVPDAPPTAPVAALRPPSRPPIVLGDENRIRQVVANLLGNARRYTPEQSPIELAVGVDAAAEMGWIAVIDHGDGIPEQIRDKIFQRFWRADTSRTRETGGSGLGLSIVASVIEALHGSITVSETPGGGATFRVAFPLATRREASEHLFIETQPLPRLSVDDQD